MASDALSTATAVANLKGDVNFTRRRPPTGQNVTTL
jgi:hypothetical protein